MEKEKGKLDREKLKDRLYKKYGIDNIEDPEIIKQIGEFKYAYDIELATRLNHAWINHLTDLNVWLKNNLSEYFREQFGKEVSFKLTNEEPFISKFEFDNVKMGNISKKTLDKVNNELINFQQYCEKCWSKALGLAAVIKNGEGVRLKTIPLLNPKPQRYLGKPIRYRTPGLKKSEGYIYSKPPRKEPFTERAITDKAVNGLVDNLAKWLKKQNDFVEWGAIELIIKYYGIDKYMPKSKNFKKQLANRIQRLNKKPA